MVYVFSAVRFSVNLGAIIVYARVQSSLLELPSERPAEHERK